MQSYQLARIFSIALGTSSSNNFPFVSTKQPNFEQPLDLILVNKLLNQQQDRLTSSFKLGFFLLYWLSEIYHIEEFGHLNYITLI